MENTDDLKIFLYRARIKNKELAEELNLNPVTMSMKVHKKYDFKLSEAFKIKDLINRKLNANYTIEDLFK